MKGENRNVTKQIRKKKKTETPNMQSCVNQDKPQKKDPLPPLILKGNIQAKNLNIKHFFLI